MKEIIEKIQEQMNRYPDPGPDDEECGYVQGLEDAARIIKGQEPVFRKGWPTAAQLSQGGQ